MKKRILYIFLSLLLLVTMVFPAIPVRAVSNLTPSQDCIAVLKKVEGFSKYPVYDYGQYSVGYGSLCPTDDYGRYRSQGITEAEAEELMMYYLNAMSNKLNQFAATNNLTLSQNQFDALLLFTYNLGTGWLSGTSDFKTAVLTGATGNDLIFYMSRWCTADYKVMPGLVRRRLAEADLFLNGNYSTNGPSYYSYVIFDPNEGACTSRVQGYDASNPPAIKATPSRTGYRFLGWYTALEGGQWITDLDATTTEKTLYARWQEGDGNVVDGVIQGTACSYKRKVNSAEKLSVYELPNAATPFAQLDSGITVKIVADYVDSAGAKWGKMEGGGWVNLGTTHQIVTAGAKTVHENITVTVTTNNVNVRTDAGTAYTAVGKVNAGDKLVICETKMVGTTKWGKYSGGWLSLDYTDYGSASNNSQLSGTPISASGTVVNCTSLRIRSGPGTNYPSLGLLQCGERVDISEEMVVGAAVWGKISAGWICLSYVKLDEVVMEVPETTPPQEESVPETTTPETPAPETTVPEQDNEVQRGVVFNCNTLNVRGDAGMSNKVVDSLTRGTLVEIYETKNADGLLWGRIKQGWICLQYVQLQVNASTQGKLGTVISSTSLNIRGDASVSSAWVGSYPSGTRIVVYETTEAGGMTWGRTDRGWVSMTYVQMDGEQNESTQQPSVETTKETITGKISGTNALRIRSGAGTHTAQVGILSKDTIVEITETTMVDGVKWGKIASGWICMTYVSTGADAEAALATVRVDGLNVRSGPGTDNPVVGSYNKGTQIEILETTMVAGIPWGRTKQGWVSLSYVSR